MRITRIKGLNGTRGVWGMGAVHGAGSPLRVDTALGER